MDKLVYKGYTAKIEFDPEEQELVGEIEGIGDLVVFSSKKCDEIKSIFHESVDSYLESCKIAGKDPDKAYTGSFNIRIDPSEHRELDRLAKKEDSTLNAEIVSAVHLLLESKASKQIQNLILEITTRGSCDINDKVWPYCDQLAATLPQQENSVPEAFDKMEVIENAHESDSAKA